MNILHTFRVFTAFLCTSHADWARDARVRTITSPSRFSRPTSPVVRLWRSAKLLDILEFIEFIFYINNVKLFRLLVCICFLFRKGLHSNLLGLQTSSNQLPQRLPSIFQHLHKDKTSDHPSNLDNAPSNNYNRVLKNCIVHHS